jgi:hypothetical protein
MPAADVISSSRQLPFLLLHTHLRSYTEPSVVPSVYTTLA